MAPSRASHLDGGEVRIGLNLDDVAPGLSTYVHDAIIANADRATD